MKLNIKTCGECPLCVENGRDAWWCGVWGEAVDPGQSACIDGDRDTLIRACHEWMLKQEGAGGLRQQGE